MGKIMLNEIDYSGGNANVIRLTQAEYDALPPTKLSDDKVYMITDVNGDGSQFQPVIYSEDEREVGVWVDGKPLYQKTYEVSNVGSSNVVVDANMSLSNIKLVGFINNGIEMNSPYSGEVFQVAIASSIVLRVFNSTSGLSCNLEGASTQTGTARFTIQYTKTTDTAGSGTWTPQGVPAVHYSTDEKVVGTWVDGSTVYQKTDATKLSLPYNETWVETNIEVTGEVISVFGSVLRDNEPIAINGLFNSSIFSKWILRNNKILISVKGESTETYLLNNITVQYTKSSQGGN